MPLNPGALTVTFNPPGAFVVDRLHTVPASSGLSSFTQPGSTRQAATVRDKIDNTAYSEASVKFITPYNTNTAGVEAEWHVNYASQDYRVLGVHRTPDGWGRILHCTFFCKEEDNGTV